ncbi:MAG: zinc-binding dehydrogenase [Deltaproteobacteria bacterium]|nr:zinc-binding dehydrogenase [Deltaproteobacteria bacterium]
MKGKMKAARFHKVNEKLTIERIPIPQIKPDEVLVDVKATGICGSDVHIVYEGVTLTGFLPITLGHEPSGVVAEVGENVTDWKVGDRVVVSAIVICGKCYNCLRGRESICINKKVLGIHFNGGLAEYMAVPSRNLVKLPDNVPFDQGAICTDAVATPYHAVKTQGRIKLSDTVAIIGLGGLGVHAIQIAKVAGASRIIGIGRTPSVLERALKNGATHVVNINDGNPAQQIKDITDGYGVDLAIEMVGTQDMIALGADCIKQGGRLVIGGLGPDNIHILPPTIFVRQELEVVGSYGWDIREIAEIVMLLSDGKLDLSNSVTQRFELDDINRALENLKDRVDHPVRLVIVQE